jgi:hypothetical protein
MAVEYLDSGNDDGTNFGRAAGKIGFYGLTTPIVKQTIVITCSTTTTIGDIALWTTDFAALVVQLKATGLFA